MAKDGRMTQLLDALKVLLPPLSNKGFYADPSCDPDALADPTWAFCLQAAGVTTHRGDVCSGSASYLDASMPPAPSPRHEYGTLDVTIEVVKDMQEAIDHIHGYGSGHTECIITEDEATAGTRAIPTHHHTLSQSLWVAPPRACSAL